MKKTSFLILLFCCTASFAQSNFQKDFDFYWKTIDDNFAYFERQKTDWQKVKVIYKPMLDTVKSKDGFIHLLETVNNELHNGHVFLNTNRNSSNRPIPTGSDLKLVYKDNFYVIDELREGYNAEACGLEKGMTVIRYNGVAIENALQEFLPRSIAKFDQDSFEYAANMLLAGKHNVKRKITVVQNGVEKDFFPDAKKNKTEEHPKTLLDQQKLEDNIGYIKINNSLGETGLIKAFDDALDGFMDTNGLILDLRETPSGGTTAIARAIMGRFTDHERAYQKHVYTAEEKETGIRRTAIEMVSPRQKIYKKPLVILVGNWTGSMGEGMAIGFDAMRRAKTVGTKMAGLLGEIYSFETPNLKVPFSFPCVQLQQVNGKPREDFMPNAVVPNPKEVFRVANELLRQKANNNNNNNGK